jgi:acyl carrier protein
VKVRGFRVELSEVEAALRQLPPVREAVVLSRPAPEAGTVQLIAYVALNAGVTADADALRSVLREKVGRHMIPSAFVILDEFPMNAHGKIDRSRLPAPPDAETELTHDAMPQTTMETSLAAIWQNVFQRPIARTANFFDLGGDSLSAAVIAARVHASLKADLNFRAFTDYPTLHELARHVETVRGTVNDDQIPITAVPRGQPLPLSFAQERIFRGSKAHEADGFKVATAYCLKGPLNIDLLRRCMDALVEHFESLRTTFEMRDGRPVQIIHPATPLALPVIDVDGSENPTERAQRVFSENADKETFDISRLPLVRFSIIRLSAHEHWLLRVSHHINSDALSWVVFYRELGRRYAALQEGRPLPALPEKPLQYADFAVWQRQVMDRATPAY